MRKINIISFVITLVIAEAGAIALAILQKDGILDDKPFLRVVKTLWPAICLTASCISDKIIKKEYTKSEDQKTETENKAK